MASEPSVSLVIVNYDGAEHLGPCLDSVAELDYPRDLIETIVVDNASTDGSRAILADEYPWVRVLPQETNLGFAGGVNAGARAAGGDCLALCNNDMKLDRSWVRELVRLYDPAGGVVCVAGLILDWEGERVDFADGYITAYGMAGQPDHGRPLAEVRIENGRELPFACGGSMLVAREEFLRLGGFDESFFALFEDVDFGWRVWLSGGRVRFAANARSYHRHHASVGKLAPHQRLFLFERNALRMLLKTIGDENLGPILAYALFLLAERSALSLELEVDEFDPSRARNDRFEATVPTKGLAPLYGAAAVAEGLADVLAERARVQALRRRSDREIFETFGRPFLPAHDDERYLGAAAGLAELFGLGTLFDRRRAATLLVVGRADETMRSLVRDALQRARVVHAGPTDGALDGAEFVRVEDAAALEALAAEADAVLVDASSPLAPAVARSGRTVIVREDVPAQEELAASADLVLKGAGAADVEALRALLERPPRGGPPEDVQLLLARWRRQYAVGRRLPYRLARVVWESLPRSARMRLRPRRR